MLMTNSAGLTYQGKAKYFLGPVSLKWEPLLGHGELKARVGRGFWLSLTHAPPHSSFEIGEGPRIIQDWSTSTFDIEQNNTIDIEQNM